VEGQSTAETSCCPGALTLAGNYEPGCLPKCMTKGVVSYPRLSDQQSLTQQLGHLGPLEKHGKKEDPPPCPCGLEGDK
jgi:hypothetical protein